MENSAPSLKIFRTKFSTSALYNGRWFENLLNIYIYHTDAFARHHPNQSGRSCSKGG